MKIISIGIALGVAAYGVLILGLLNLLYYNMLIWVFIPLLLVCVYNTPKVKLENHPLFDRTLLVMLILAFMFSLAGALAPPIGGDALAYHLDHPKRFVEAHSVHHIPYTRESLWPYLTEMLYTLGLMLKIPVKLFHYVFGVLSTCLVYAFAKRYINTRTAILAATLFYLSPGIFMQATYAYVDLSLCFYVFGSFYLFMRWTDKRKTKYLILSGIFSGFALSVKVLAGIAIIPILCLLVYEKPRLKEIGAFIIPTILCSFIWYLRSYLILGNPVYPFLSDVFGTGWASPIGQDIGYTKGLVGFLRLPWDLVMHYKSFGSERIGGILIVLLPCLALVKWNKVTRYLAFFTVCYTAIWFKVSPNIRFLFPVFPAIFILLASGAERVYESRLIKTIILIILTFNLSFACYYNIKPMGYLITRNSHEYLLENESSYGVAQWVNLNISDDSILVIENEPRTFYFNVPLVRSYRLNGEEFDFTPYKNIYHYYVNTPLPNYVFKKIWRGYTYTIYKED